MKYVVVFILGCITGFSYGYLRGYCIGYDDAKEAYTSFYEKLRSIEKEIYEDRLKLFEPFKDEGKE